MTHYHKSRIHTYIEFVLGNTQILAHPSPPLLEVSAFYDPIIISYSYIYLTYSYIGFTAQMYNINIVWGKSLLNKNNTTTRVAYQIHVNFKTFDTDKKIKSVIFNKGTLLFQQ